LTGFRPHITNGAIQSSYATHKLNNQEDVSVQPDVYDYMYDHGWQDAHVLWHQARGCSGSGGAVGINGLPSACKFTDFLPKQNDCQGAVNGLDFLSGHRLMREQLLELWPDNAEQFTGWTKFPRTAADYPAPIRPYFTAWPKAILDIADIADNIEAHISEFPTEGDLGTWISCSIKPGVAGGANFSTARNLHFALHANGVPTQNQKHAANNNNVNLDAYLFWKLHGWIDNVWDRYRAAKQKTKNDADYKAEMLQQCREMDKWREVGMETRGTKGHPNQQLDFVPAVKEAGFFHEKIRPALESATAKCSTCHGAGEEAGLRLGYQVPSTEIVERLIGRTAHNTNDFKMVVPGNPEKSWLYLKASGKSGDSGAVCTANAACKQTMSGLSSQNIQDLYDWIKDGAKAPTIVQ
jgi:cytochrome c553